MSAEKVQAALFQYVATQLAGKAVQWPNMAFSPPNASTWYRVHYLPAARTVETLGEEGEDQLDGLVQIDVNVPNGTGEKTMREALATLENAFTAGEVAAYSGQEASILGCRRSPGRDVDGFFRVSLSVDFRARIQRPPLTT